MISAVIKGGSPLLRLHKEDDDHIFLSSLQSYKSISATIDD